MVDRSPPLEVPRAAAGPSGPWSRSRWTLPVAAGAGFLAGLDTTAVNLALPDLQRDLDASLGELQWVVNAFALLSATVLVAAGDLSDRFGALRVFGSGLVGFAASSAACGLAWSPLVLDVARAAQGASSAVVTASGLAVVVRAYPSAERGRALGLYGSIAALSFVVGPLAGGLLTDALGWRAVFVVNVPVALAIALAATRLRLPGPATSAAPRAFDQAGLLTLTVGLAGVQYAALQADQARWSSPAVGSAAVLGLLGLVAFVVVERRTAEGIVDLGLFRDRTFTGATLAIALAAAAYFGMLVYLSLFLQSTRHYGALEAGLVYLPTILPYMVAAPLSGRLVERLPGPAVPATGCALMSLGLLLLTTTDDHTGVLEVTPAMLVTGVGSGLVVTSLMKLALDRVPTQRAGMAGGVLQTVRPLGVTVGVTTLGLGVPGVIDADSFRTVALTAAALAALAAVVAGTLIRSSSAQRGKG